jgi:alkylresorcinol/alkylpyrone synthase
MEVGGESSGVKLARIARPSIALPPHRLTPVELAHELPRIFADSAISGPALLRMANRCGVERRFLVRPLAETIADVDLGERSRIYALHAVELAARAAASALQQSGVAAAAVDLVISVSCTGYMLPSLDAHLVARLGLRPDVRRLPITELGCVAGAAALSRAADYLRGYPDSRVLVIAVETPSLTFQPTDASPDNAVSALIFGDGAAAVVLGAELGPACEILDSASLIAPGTLSEMGFDLRANGFWVVLSAAVPDLLRRGLRDLVVPLLARHELCLEDLGFFCVHPGGPKILKAVGEALGIEHRLEHAWAVLRDYGNLSSASILFVLQRLYDQPPSPGSLGLLLAFGPGLSLEALLVRWSC